MEFTTVIRNILLGVALVWIGLSWYLYVDEKVHLTTAILISIGMVFTAVAMGWSLTKRSKSGG
ncbi:hypothetical protein [Negadavirga shengliensis]|uniref:Uncharacterized protein n=1 Tax=Negadavirga shengliensis TaxID=1389218 RepID=A0ABV9T1N9_9BACT